MDEFYSAKILHPRVIGGSYMYIYYYTSVFLMRLSVHQMVQKVPCEPTLALQLKITWAKIANAVLDVGTKHNKVY